MDLLSVLEYVIKKGRPHGHRYGKKPGDKEYYLTNQLKKKCKKREFQGIHDRFLRDPEFRNRMIDKNRDEGLCRTWDALADEDHTHHLTPQERSFYKGNWWLHSNKQGSNTVRTTHRSDFKQTLSALQQLKRKAEGALQTPTDSHRNQQWAQSSSSWWNWQGSWWTLYSYESHDAKIYDRTVKPVVFRFSNKTSDERLSRFFFVLFLVAIGSFTADSGLLYSTGDVSTTPQMTCFRGAKVCRKWLQGKVTINSYSLTTS